MTKPPNARAMAGEFEIEGLKTLIPFHQAILATRQWADAETCRDLIEDRDWLKQLAFPAPAGSGGDEAPEGPTAFVATTVNV